MTDQTTKTRLQLLEDLNTLAGQFLDKLQEYSVLVESTPGQFELLTPELTAKFKAGEVPLLELAPTVLNREHSLMVSNQTRLSLLNWLSPIQHERYFLKYCSNYEGRYPSNPQDVTELHPDILQRLKTLEAELAISILQTLSIPE